MINWFSKIIFYNILGWKFKGSIPDDKKIIAILGPHTSAYDFIMCIIGRSVLKMNNRIKFLGKAELFKNPLYKFFFTTFGGYPVDRSKKNNLVDSIVEIYNSKDEFFVTIAPEGTRKKVDKLKTGFYYIALKAKIPILMIGLDFEKKLILISKLFYVTGDINKDMEFFIDFFRPITGKVPQNGLNHL
tara:strand:- start:2774 stop:3334 length:561 start_codon:yes stop_codon:yes gene_type:complete